MFSITGHWGLLLKCSLANYYMAVSAVSTAWKVLDTSTVIEVPGEGDVCSCKCNRIVLTN